MLIEKLNAIAVDIDVIAWKECFAVYVTRIDLQFQ